MIPELLSPVWSHLTDLQVVRGAGVYLYDAEGRRYADFTSGIGVTSTGHCHPKVVRAIREQAERLIFAQINCVISPQTAALAEVLSTLTPPRINTFFFANSGAEATEAAVKLARHATQRSNIIVFQGSFHGRTAQTMAMTTSKTAYRHKYQPLPAGVFVAPFPYSYFYGWDEDRAVEFCLRQLELLLKGQSAPDETVAMITEPILGEGGYVPAPASFLRGLREVCDRHGILLILDEVQTGFGRTGKLFAFEHAGITPDAIIMAKGLGGGLPISALAASRELMARWETGSHGGTYGGGNAVVMAGARAGVEVILEEDLVGNAERMGERLKQGLLELQARFPVMGDVRGRGLMVGVEFTGEDGEPDASAAQAVQKGCLEQKLLLLTCGSYGNVIRWIPPLVVTAEQLDEALERFCEHLERALSPAHA